VAGLPVDLGAMAVGANLHRAAQAGPRELERTVLRPEGLSFTGFSLLFNLWVWGAMQTRALASSMGCTRATVSSVSDTLERAAWSRARATPSDRRLVQLELTPAGRRSSRTSSRASTRGVGARRRPVPGGARAARRAPAPARHGRARRRGGRGGVVSARTEVEGVSVPTEHYIDGRRVASADTFEVRSPIDWDGFKLADVAPGRKAEVDLAGRRRAPGRSRLGRARPGGPREVLARLADAIQEAVPQLAAVETVDNGSLHEAMALRVLPRGANNIRFFADFAVERLAEPERTLHGGERNRVRYDPAGVTAVSTPWNAPFMLATWRVGPALAAGNTVVLKPPEWAPLTCSMLGDLADAAGVPPGVLNIVHGTGARRARR
jgi:DNA-binding MarR family transcriptional regulator